MQFGNVKEVDLKYTSTGEFRRFGFVSFDTLAAAQAVLDNGTKNKIENKWIDCRCAGDETQPDGQYRGFGTTAKARARVDSMLRLRGVPFQAKPEDVLLFFDEFKPTAATTCSDQHGRPSGEALVEFQDATSCAAALALKQGGNIGHRYMELFTATLEDIAKMKPLRTATAARDGDGQAVY